MNQPPKKPTLSAEEEWSRAAAAGRSRTLLNVLVAVICLLVMACVAFFFLLSGSLMYAVLSLSMGVVFAIWAASGKLVQGLKSLVGIRR